MTVAKVIANRIVQFSEELSVLADGESTNDAVIELLAALDTALRQTSFQVRKIAKNERLETGWCDQMDHSYGRGTRSEEYPKGTVAKCSLCRVDGYTVNGNLVPREVAEAAWRNEEWKRTGPDVNALCDAFSALAAIAPKRKSNHKILADGGAA